MKIITVLLLTAVVIGGVSVYADTLPESVLNGIAMDEVNKSCQYPDHEFVHEKTGLANHKPMVVFYATYKGIEIENTYGYVLIDYDGTIIRKMGGDSCPDVASRVRLDSVLSADSIKSIILHDTANVTGPVEYSVNAYSGVILDRYCGSICTSELCCPPADGNVTRIFDTDPALIVGSDALVYRTWVSIRKDSSTHLSSEHRTSLRVRIGNNRRHLILHTGTADEREEMQLKIYSLGGSKVLMKKRIPSGRSTVSLERISNGVYILSLQGNHRNIKRMIVVR